MRTFRQGDVLLEKMESLPAGASLQSHDGNRIVLAFGEATGHAHAVSTSHAQLYTANHERYLLAVEGARLVHEEHAAIDLEPGVYRVIQQREYIPQATGKHPGYSAENREIQRAPGASRHVKD